METSDERVAWFVLVATIPAGVVGLAGENGQIADHLGEPWQILILLAAGALLLLWADRSSRERDGDLGLRHAVVMGCAQALALAPGSAGRASPSRQAAS